jgi:hypothetical protein
MSLTFLKEGLHASSTRGIKQGFASIGIVEGDFTSFVLSVLDKGSFAREIPRMLCRGRMKSVGYVAFPEINPSVFYECTYQRSAD